MTIVALPWFVLATTGSTAKMGLVLACQTLPAFALGIPAGRLVAALGPRRSLVLGDALRAPLLAAVPVLHWPALLSFPLLLVLVTAIGVFSVPYAAAASSILPEIVGEDASEVARAQAALQVAIQVTGVDRPGAGRRRSSRCSGSPQLLLLSTARATRSRRASSSRSCVASGTRARAPSGRAACSWACAMCSPTRCSRRSCHRGARRARRARGAVRVAARARVPRRSTTRARAGVLFTAAAVGLGRSAVSPRVWLARRVRRCASASRASRR